MSANKYTFSGHESFSCKTLWLKKGYDFVKNNYDFNDAYAVVSLGVGKNMVASIRYWMRVFGMTENDKLTEISSYLLNTETGKDPYMEDLATLWLLHFLLVSRGEASLYKMLFTQFQRERKHFERTQVVSFVKRILTDKNKLGLYNENTVKKDVGTLLQMYVLPQKAKALDEYTSLLIDLELIRIDADGKSFLFNTEGKRQIPWQIFLYAILSLKGNENTIGYDSLQELGLVFCMSDMEVIEMCKLIEEKHPKEVKYSDTAGIRQVQLLAKLEGETVLNEYYG
jgi:hypothetical protein